MPLHPLYGEYQPGWKVCPQFPSYEINEYSQVRRVDTKKQIQDTNYVVTVFHQGKRHKMRRYKLCLLAFFPNVTPKPTVDHIDECHENHFVENLQYLTSAENSAKSNRLRHRSQATVSKPVWQKTLEGTLVKEYPSSIAAELATHIRGSSIRRACRKAGQAGGFLWTWAEADWHKDLPNEIWTTNEKVASMLRQKQMSTQLLVSNLGRIQTPWGRKTKGARMSRQRKYRMYSRMLVHQLVWAAFGNRNPQSGELILHDDQQPLDAEGCFSNAFAHLRLGTQSENMKECHEFGALAQRKSQKRTFSEMAL
jgi:hypothetical protein